MNTPVFAGSIVLEAALLSKGKPPPPPQPCPACGEPTDILVAVGHDPHSVPGRCLDCMIVLAKEGLDGAA